jgi:hypothetical protein
VEQYWVCQHCRSLNRGGAARCYSCKEKFGSRPKADAPINPEPPRPAVTATRQDLGMGQVPPAYISKPLAPALGPTSFSSSAAAAAAEARRGPAGPVTVIKRRIARSLAAHPIVGVRVIGWLAALLVVASVVVGGALAVLLAPVALDVLQVADAPLAWRQLAADRQAMILVLSAATAGVGLLALLFLSLFIGLTTHNAPALGADMALLTPYAAGVSWPRGLWHHLQIAIATIVPTVIVWLGYTIPGLILAIVFVEIALHRLGDPWGWFRGLNRHVPDLYAKLGTEGSMDSILASTWALLFRLANSLAILVWTLPPIAFAVEMAVKASGRAAVPGWQPGGIGPLQGAVAVLIGATLLAAAVASLLTVPLILGFIGRQKRRRELVRMGRARQWVGGKPVAADYASVAPGKARPAGWDEDDRIVERVPRDGPGADDGGAALLESFNARRGPGASLGASSTGPSEANESPDQFPGRGFDSDDDQASLNSPSTTSSFPWSEESPASPE